MALPLSGQLSLGNIRTELGIPGVTDFRLSQASIGGIGPYPVINKYSRYRPSSASPYRISDWYGYNHTVNTYFYFQPSTFWYGPTFLEGFYFSSPSNTSTIPASFSFSIILQLIYPSSTSIVTFSDTCTPTQYNIPFFPGYDKDLSTVYPGITSFNIFASPFTVTMGGVIYRGSSTLIL
jgi:hypothetical protein